MPHRKIVLAVLLLLGMAVATAEESFVHEDDGCVVETHCNACLLWLGSPGVVTPTFSLTPALASVQRVALPSPPAHQDATPRAIASRGPPLA